MALTAREMVTLLEDAVASNIGVRQVTVDGQTIQFADRAALLEELDRWKRLAARENTAASTSVRRGPFRSVDLGSAF